MLVYNCEWYKTGDSEWSNAWVNVFPQGVGSAYNTWQQADADARGLDRWEQGGQQPTEGPIVELAELTGWSIEEIDCGLCTCSAFFEWQQVNEVPELLLDQILASAPAFKKRFGSYFHSSAEGTQEDLGDKLLAIFETWQTVFAQEVLGEAFTLAQQLLEQYRAPFEQLLTEQLGSNSPAQGEAQSDSQAESEPSPQQAEAIEGWMLPQFSTPPITFESKANQRAKGVMKQDPQNHDITFSLEQLKQNMQTIQQEFEAATKQELEQYFGQQIPQAVQQHFATCRNQLEQRYSEFMQAQTQQAQEQMRDEILASVHRVETELEQQRQDFDALQNQVNKL